MAHDFQTARLFLSHYGFLSLEALKVNLTVCARELVVKKVPSTFERVSYENHSIIRSTISKHGKSFPGIKKL